MLLHLLTPSNLHVMRNLDITEKHKGLINRKDWEIGTLRLYEDDLAAICRDGKEFYVFKDSVSRFTGFVTNSGEEIFEGDILSVVGKNEDALLEVFWDEASRLWKVGCPSIQDSRLCQLLAKCLNSRIVGHVFTHQYKLRAFKTNPLNEGEVVKLI